MKSNSSLRLGAQQIEIYCISGKRRRRSFPFSSYWTNPVASTCLEETVNAITTMNLDGSGSESATVDYTTAVNDMLPDIRLHHITKLTTRIVNKIDLPTRGTVNVNTACVERDRGFGWRMSTKHIRLKCRLVRAALLTLGVASAFSLRPRGFWRICPAIPICTSSLRPLNVCKHATVSLTCGSFRLRVNQQALLMTMPNTNRPGSERRRSWSKALERIRFIERRSGLIGDR